MEKKALLDEIKELGLEISPSPREKTPMPIELAIENVDENPLFPMDNSIENAIRELDLS